MDEPTLVLMFSAVFLLTAGIGIYLWRFVGRDIKDVKNVANKTFAQIIKNEVVRGSIAEKPEKVVDVVCIERAKPVEKVQEIVIGKKDTEPYSEPPIFVDSPDVKNNINTIRDALGLSEVKKEE
jgi:hypothetical protein